MTPQEARLWLSLRELRYSGFHIRRQAPFRGYYLDFVCFSRRVVIELDGSQHGEDAAVAHDAARDEVLRRGLQVLRFWNSEVNTDIDAVMETVLRELQSLPPTRPPSGATLPMKGREV